MITDKVAECIEARGYAVKSVYIENDGGHMALNYQRRVTPDGICVFDWIAVKNVPQDAPDCVIEDAVDSMIDIIECKPRREFRQETKDYIESIKAKRRENQ